MENDSPTMQIEGFQPPEAPRGAIELGFQPDLDITNRPMSQVSMPSFQQIQSRRAIQKLHPGNRFRLMMGLPLLEEEVLDAIQKQIAKPE